MMCIFHVQRMVIMDRRAGFYKTNLLGDAAYQSFLPAPLPPKPPIALDTETIDLLVSNWGWNRPGNSRKSYQNRG